MIIDMISVQMKDGESFLARLLLMKRYILGMKRSSNSSSVTSVQSGNSSTPTR